MHSSGQHIDVEELVCLWVWEGDLALSSEVVGGQWVGLWGDGEGWSWAGARSKLAGRCSEVLCSLWDTQAMWWQHCPISLWPLSAHGCLLSSCFIWTFTVHLHSAWVVLPIQDPETVAWSTNYFLLMAHFGYVNNILPLHLPNVDPAERNESGFPC